MARVAQRVAPMLFLHLVLQLFATQSRLMLMSVYLAVGVLLIGNTGGLIVEGVRQLPNSGEGTFWYGIAGPMAWLAPAYMAAVIGLAVIRLFYTARLSHGIRRAQASYLMVAIVPPTVIALHDILGLFVNSYPGGDVTFMPLMPLGSVFWAAPAWH